MLYWLLYEKLFPFFHPFRIFRYLTFRTAFASLTALLIGINMRHKVHSAGIRFTGLPEKK